MTVYLQFMCPAWSVLSPPYLPYPRSSSPSPTLVNNVQYTNLHKIHIFLLTFLPFFVVHIGASCHRGTFCQDALKTSSAGISLGGELCSLLYLQPLCLITQPLSHSGQPPTGWCKHLGVISEKVGYNADFSLSLSVGRKGKKVYALFSLLWLKLMNL